MRRRGEERKHHTKAYKWKRRRRPNHAGWNTPPVKGKEEERWREETWPDYNS